MFCLTERLGVNVSQPLLVRYKREKPKVQQVAYSRDEIEPRGVLIKETIPFGVRYSKWEGGDLVYIFVASLLLFLLVV